MANVNPPGLPLTVGEQFTIRTGPRRLLYEGDFRYFQKRNHRYFCRVVSVRHERFLYRQREPRVRCAAVVEVVESIITTCGDRSV